ncbi:MAG: hypothetical protein HY865_20355 [Chloroflexi bacterium]|nr:hypothetical protein [Chloroflexota bacterium]
MRRKRVLLFVLTFLFLSYSCAQELATTPTPIGPIFGSPVPTVENPMEMIAEFGRQTKVAQTEAANPSHLSPFDLTQTSPAASADREILHVVFSYTSRTSYNLSDLEALPQTTVSVNGQEVKGVALLAVLDRAGWETYDAVAVSLNGIGSLTFPSDGIEEDFILVVTGSSLRFISPSVPENMWIDGVTIIEVY